MRISTKLWLCISILLVGYFLTVAIGWWQSLASERLLRRVGDSVFSASLLSQRADTAFLVEARAYQDAVLQGEAGDLVEARATAADVDGLLVSISRLDLDADCLALCRSLRSRHASFALAAGSFYPLMMSDAGGDRLLERAQRLHAETESIRSGLSSLKESLSGDMRSELDAVVSKSGERRHWRLVAFSIIAFISVGLTLYVAAQLTRRLDALVLSSDRLSRGEFEAVVADPRGDEIGALAKAFDAMRLAVRGRDLDLRALNGSLEASVRARTLELSLRNQDLTREVQERQRAEESLRLLESAVTQTEDALVIAEVAEAPAVPGVVYVNRAFTRMFGLSPAEIAGRPLTSVTADPAGRQRIASLHSSAGAGHPGLEEIERIASDGSRRMTEWRIGPIRGPDGSVSHVVATVHDISDRKRAEAELREVHDRLIDASRQAGQAEVATGVLHNVGNVLNSINVSASVVCDRLDASKSGGLGKAVAMLESHGAALSAYLSVDVQRQRVLSYLGLLARSIEDERRDILTELKSLTRNVDHVKDVVGMQQSYARSSGFVMLVSPRELMEDALRMQEAAFTRHRVEIERDYEDLPQLTIDKHRTLQILINLVSNAKHAVDAGGEGTRRIRVSIRRTQADRLRFVVGDNGDGIAEANLERVFSLGFTTRPEGHGFGLHSSALAAKEMRGSLVAESAGSGLGATFTLELPV